MPLKRFKQETKSKKGSISIHAWQEDCHVERRMMINSKHPKFNYVKIKPLPKNPMRCVRCGKMADKLCFTQATFCESCSKENLARCAKQEEKYIKAGGQSFDDLVKNGYRPPQGAKDDN